MAQILISRARKLDACENNEVGIEEIVYVLNASTIDLCLSLFLRASFRCTKSAIKLRTMIDLRGSTPVFIVNTEGKVHDVRIVSQIVFKPSAFYVMDRGYVDFELLAVAFQPNQTEERSG